MRFRHKSKNLSDYGNIIYYNIVSEPWRPKSATISDACWYMLTKTIIWFFLFMNYIFIDMNAAQCAVGRCAKIEMN